MTASDSMRASSVVQSPVSTSRSRVSTFRAFPAASQRTSWYVPGGRMWKGLLAGNWTATLNAARPASRASSASARASPGRSRRLCGIEDVPERAEAHHAGRERLEERLERPGPKQVLRQEGGQAAEGAVRLPLQDVRDEDLYLLRATVPGVPDAQIEVVGVGRRARGAGVREQGVVEVRRLWVHLQPEPGADEETRQAALEGGDRRGGDGNGGEDPRPQGRPAGSPRHARLLRTPIAPYGPAGSVSSGRSVGNRRGRRDVAGIEPRPAGSGRPRDADERLETPDVLADHVEA